jgi:hypothetical protein
MMMNPFRWRSIATASSRCRLSGILATIAGSAALAVLFGIVFAGHFMIWPIERLHDPHRLDFGSAAIIVPPLEMEK